MKNEAQFLSSGTVFAVKNLDNEHGFPCTTLFGLAGVLPDLYFSTLTGDFL